MVAACHAVRAGDGDLFVAGGVESMSRAPLVTAKPDRAFPRGDRTLYDTTLGWRFPNPRMQEMFPLESMGETGENVAERWQVTRADQDAFALESQRRWAEADAAGRFADELMAVGDLVRDEHPRPGADAAALAKLRPAFRDGGTVTAGNSSGINDGAAALVIASGERAQALGARPLARFVAAAVAGVDPRVMGIGPVPAVRKLLARAGVEVADIDLVELNEAFASQSVAVIRELGLDPGIVNVNGGAIALGHPLGMSGARLVVSLLHELGRRGGRRGLATLCIGVGQGQAALFDAGGMSEIETAAEGAVLTIRLNRPQVLNAFTAAMHEQLAAALAAAADPQVRAVVITGEGRGFCVGQDVSEFPRDAEAVGALLRRRYNPAIGAIRALEKPVIAAVNGPAAGAGLALALACDIRLAAASASFVPAFLGIGLVPDSGLSLTLAQLLGPAAAFEWVVDGRKLGAAEAQARGLVSQVVEDDRLAGAAAERAAALAAGPTRAIALTKRLFAQAAGAGLAAQLELEADLQAEAAATADFGEGVAAFLEKRPPRFLGH